MKAKIGLIGLAVMGKNLARNIADKNIAIVVYNRTTEKMADLIEEHGNKFLFGEKDLKNFVNSIERPRKIIIMVQAGAAVDLVIEQLVKFIDKNDIIIDCGNSNYKDTQRRFLELQKKQINFIGCGVSGGEEGALNGPSLMPGGEKISYKKIEAIFTKIAAKDFSNKACITFIGENGAGHFVKMVHNGIEYGVMQIMAEAYDILKNIYKLPAPKIAEIFKKYNQGKLSSYLFEIASEVLNKKDDQNKNSKSPSYLIDKILDKAGQKGTGTWTAIDSLERASQLSVITEAVYARIASGEKEKRITLSHCFKKSPGKNSKKITLEKFTKILENAIYSAMLISYAQGYDLIQKAAKKENWKIDLGEISRIWEGGCIIRAKILNFLHKTYQKSGKKSLHLFEIPEVQKALKSNIDDLRTTITTSIDQQIPTPSLSAALSYFDSITSETLPANLIQGLRDYFGAHTYERIDKKGHFHTDWD